MEKIEIKTKPIYDENGWIIGLDIHVNDGKITIPNDGIEKLIGNLSYEKKHFRVLCPLCVGRKGCWGGAPYEDEWSECNLCKGRGWFKKNKKKRTKCKHEEHKASLIDNKGRGRYVQPHCVNKDCDFYKKICSDYVKYYSDEYLIDSCDKKEAQEDE